MSVNWNDPNDHVSANFRVHEALWLPSWRVYHVPSDAEKAEILKTAVAMEKIRTLMNAPIVVHCWMRPVKTNAPGTPHHGKNYNKFVGSKATKSGHIFGQAVDFHVSGRVGPAQCQQVRETLLPYLEAWDIRMEDMAGGWIHIDTKPVTGNRFFKP